MLFRIRKLFCQLVGIEYVKYGYIGKGAQVMSPKRYDNNQNLVSIGEETIILPDSRIQLYPHLVDDAPHIRIGKRCYIGYYFSLLAGADINIGNDVLIASNVIISSENHGMDPESDIPYMNQKLIGRPVSIGDGTWIGEKVCILPGVQIGKKCVIGAGSVVTKDIPDYSVAVGNPARVIKIYSFSSHGWESV